jgi:aldehyde:ferredoxin oxidoreductase
MGSKRLKAIAIERGSGRVAVHDSERLSALATEIHEYIKNDETNTMYRWGTSMGFAGGIKSGHLPVRNYSTNIFPEWEPFMGDRVRSKFEIKPNPCWACQMHHCHIMKVTEGPYAGFVGEEPEYEQWADWGPIIGNTDVGAAVVLSNDVDRLGVETNEAAWVVGWVMECYEKGIFTAKDLDGLEMKWGNVEGARTLLRKLANREGIGNLLAEGVKCAAEKIGGEALERAIFTQKGNSPRGHDHRARWTEMFETCVSNTSTIEVGLVLFPNELGLPEQTDGFSGMDVSTTVAKASGRMIFEDTLGTCRFCTRVSIGKLAEALNAATSWDFDTEESLKVGRRIVNLLRVFNFRNGITADLEYPSKRYGSTPIDGPVVGKSIAPHWGEMLRNYYTLQGWDLATGKPTPETLRKYGLEDTIAHIWG